MSPERSDDRVDQIHPIPLPDSIPIGILRLNHGELTHAVLTLLTPVMQNGSATALERQIFSIAHEGLLDEQLSVVLAGVFRSHRDALNGLETAVLDLVNSRIVI